MGEDEAVESGFAAPRQFLGFEVYRDQGMVICLRGRWRFIWHNPLWRENWRIDGAFSEGGWHVGVGPAMIVYVRSEDF